MKQEIKEFILNLLQDDKEYIDALLEKRRILLGNMNHFLFPKRIDLESCISDLIVKQLKLKESIEEISKL